MVTFKIDSYNKIKIKIKSFSHFSGLTSSQFLKPIEKLYYQKIMIYIFLILWSNLKLSNFKLFN